MLTKENLSLAVFDAVKKSGIKAEASFLSKISVDYPEPQFGDYTTNAALMLAKSAGMKPRDLAQKIIDNLQVEYFDRVEIAGSGFINFFVKKEFLLAEVSVLSKQGTVVHPKKDGKMLVEYFQPNIAKPMHIGLVRTAVIGDAIRRSLEYLGFPVESDTHMGDWGTQFGFVILAYKKYGDPKTIQKDPINELNNLYVRVNAEAEEDESVREAAKQEFVKLEAGDPENTKIWKQAVDWSMEKFLKINELMDIKEFDHHWPESFYEDKMPAVLEKLKAKGLLKESKGAQIVDLEDLGLGVAVVVKSDKGTTYLLRDLATFIYRKSLGFEKQLYVVDTRQTHAFRQLFAILKLMGEMSEGEGEHIDYGFIGFKGSALSTRKGNMVLAEDVLAQAKEKVAKIIEEKNPDLANKYEVINSVAKGAIKYYDLSHNRKSDYDFDWDEALDFNGNSGPYLQYVYARLSSILKKENSYSEPNRSVEVTETERRIMVELTKLDDMVESVVKEYQPNVMTSYLYNFAGLVNKFYHESPVLKETDQDKKNMRLALISATKNVLAKGLDLLGIKALEEM